MYVFLSRRNRSDSFSWHNYHLKTSKTPNQSWVAGLHKLSDPQRTFLFIHIITAWSLQTGNEPFANEMGPLTHNTLTYSHFPVSTRLITHHVLQVVGFAVRDVSRVLVRHSVRRLCGRALWRPPSSLWKPTLVEMLKMKTQRKCT